MSVVNDYNFEEEKKPSKSRSRLLSYFLIGVVGAVIGGLVVAAFVPSMVMHKMGMIPLTAQTTGTSSGSSSGTTTSTSGSTTLYPTSDPWQIVAAVAEKVSPAVVGIVNESTGGVDFFGRQLTQQSTGSGLILTSDGYIVTNNHVVENAKSLTVFLADGTTAKARIVGTDPKTDIAVIKVDATNLPVGVFGDSDQVKPGQLAVAIGNPLGMDFKRTVTQGVISGLDRVLQVGDGYVRLIQTDAVINPGNSGGPLVNAKGEVIGLNSAKLSANSVEGMGFAIPSNLVKRIAQELIDTGKVRRALVGIQVVDRQMAEAYLNVHGDKGIYVYDVTSGGPAAKAGIRKGDFIIKFAGTDIDDTGTFLALLAEKLPGETVPCTILRNGQQINVNIVLGEASQ